MRIVNYKNIKVTKQEMSKLLGVKVDHFEERDDCIKVCIGSHRARFNSAVFLRCEDLKVLLNIKFNLLDKDIIVERNEIDYVDTEEEVYKGNVKPDIIKKIKALTE